MNNKISAKGKEYLLEQNVGMTDLDGNVIIPKEYDRIIQEDDELFAALVDNPDSGVTLEKYASRARSALCSEELKCIWNKDVKKKISAINIDFYSLAGKFKCNKKILAYYYSAFNNVLVLLDENYTWSIAYIDYENYEIIEDKKYANISEIKEIHDGRFLIKHGIVYKVISLRDKIEFELPEDIIDVEDYSKGLVIKKKEGYCGFVDYLGKEILSCAYSKILPEEDYIRIDNFCRQSIRSYEGKELVPYFNAIYPCCVKGECIFMVKNNVFECDPTLYGLHSPKYGTILEPEYSRIEIDKDGTIVYCRDGDWGIAKYDEENHRVIGIISGHVSHMRFNHHGHNRYIIARKGFRYAIYDTEGRQIRKFRYRWFIPKKDLYMYDYFEWL